MDWMLYESLIFRMESQVFVKQKKHN